jgi:hypothetical protein
VVGAAKHGVCMKSVLQLTCCHLARSLSGCQIVTQSTWELKHGSDSISGITIECIAKSVAAGGVDDNEEVVGPKSGQRDVDPKQSDKKYLELVAPFPQS